LTWNFQSPENPTCLVAFLLPFVLLSRLSKISQDRLRRKTPGRGFRSKRSDLG